MAYVETQISAGEIAARAQDKPILCATNALENYNATPQWRVSGSWASGTNITDTTNGPTYFAYDRSVNGRQTTCTSISGQTEVSFLMNLEEGTDDEHSIDCMAILGHNLSALGANVVVQLQIADSSDFATNLITPVQFNLNGLPSGLRLANANMRSNSYRYTNVRYARLRISKSSGSFGSTTPAFSELWLGRRRQTSFFPRTPHDEQQTESDFVDHISDGGTRTRYVKSHGRRIFELSYNPGNDDASLADSIGFANTMRSWWDECEHGTKPSLYFESPINFTYTAGDHCCVVYPDDSNFHMPAVGPFERELSLRLVETAPYLSSEG